MATPTKQSSVQFSYDDEKLEAVRIFLQNKGTTLEAELVNMMDQIYRKNVPSDVRNYLDVRAGKPITVSKRGRRSAETETN